MSKPEKDAKVGGRSVQQRPKSATQQKEPEQNQSVLSESRSRKCDFNCKRGCSEVNETSEVKGRDWRRQRNQVSSRNNEASPEKTRRKLLKRQTISSRNREEETVSKAGEVGRKERVSFQPPQAKRETERKVPKSIPGEAYRLQTTRRVRETDGRVKGITPDHTVPRRGVRTKTLAASFKTKADGAYGSVRRDDADNGVIVKVSPPMVASTAGERLAQARELLACPNEVQVSPGREKVRPTAAHPQYVQKTVSRDRVTLDYGVVHGIPKKTQVRRSQIRQASDPDSLKPTVAHGPQPGRHQNPTVGTRRVRQNRPEESQRISIATQTRRSERTSIGSQTRRSITHFTRRAAISRM